MLFSHFSWNPNLYTYDEFMAKLIVCPNCGTRWPDFDYIVTPSILDYVVFDGGILSGRFFAYTYCNHCDRLEFSPFSMLPDEYRAVLDTEAFQEMLRQRTEPLSAICYLASAYIMKEIMASEEGWVCLVLGAAAKYEKHNNDAALQPLLNEALAAINRLNFPSELQIAANTVLTIKLKQWDKASKWIASAWELKKMPRCYRDTLNDLEILMNLNEDERVEALRDKKYQLLYYLYDYLTKSLRSMGYRTKILGTDVNGGKLLRLQMLKYKEKMPELSKLIAGAVLITD